MDKNEAERILAEEIKKVRKIIENVVSLSSQKAPEYFNVLYCLLDHARKTENLLSFSLLEED